MGLIHTMLCLSEHNKNSILQVKGSAGLIIFELIFRPSYFNEPENDAIVELSETLFNSERLRLETVAKAYNHLGLRVQVTNEDTILQKMIADYSTGRMANRGA